jgi:rhamnosyltransferase
MHTYAVVVTYHPNYDRLTRLLSALRPQVADVIIIDNTQVNVGIAAAQNVGIKEAIARGAKHVALFDQDSVPAPDMLGVLRTALVDLERSGEKIAAVGPNYWHGSGLKISGSSPTRVDLIIASGCLLSVQALRDVGLMNEALFIDLVETEWLLRAKQRGWNVYQCPSAMMEHQLGDGDIRIWLGKWHHVPEHSPLRHYYYVRNSVYLSTHSSLPLGWKLSSLKRLLLRFFAFGTRRDHAAMMLAGVRDGLLGKLGSRQH